MGTMGRILRWPIALLLIAFGLLWPLVFTGASSGAPASDPVTFSNYQADYVVDADGRMDAVETITAEFPLLRHGIFRYWDIANQNSSRVRQEPTVTSVLMDDQPIPYALSWKDGNRFRVAKIGDPDNYLDSGTHVFQIRYTIDGVLDPGTTGADKSFAFYTRGADVPTAFFWNVVAPGWDNRIDKAEIFVTLPGPVAGVGCSVGAGVGTACQDLNVHGNRVQLAAQDLAPRTPVTLRAAVDVPTPARATLPWSYKFDRILGQSVFGSLSALALTVAAAIGGLLWWRSTVEPPPGFPVQYAPPAGIGPVQSEYIRTEAVSRDALTATLFYLAERQLISLTQVSEKNWTIRGIAEAAAWADIDPVSRQVGHALKVDEPGTEFDANGTVSAGTKFTAAKNDVSAAVKQWAFTEGLMVKKGSERWAQWAAAVALVAALLGFFLAWGFPATIWALPFAVFFLITVRTWGAGVGTRRTPAGRELWSQVGGFHRMLATDSAETRFDFAARKDLYTAYIPFAVACGAAALWAKKYQTSMGTAPPQPDWYHSSSGTYYGAVGSSGGSGFDSFESALSSSIGAYTASQSSSSSAGGGGGGGGGDGGGGGGGGSW